MAKNLSVKNFLKSQFVGFTFYFQLYLNRHKYANAAADDLWSALSEVNMQMKHAERRPNILRHFVWWVRFSVSRDEPERERTKTGRTVGRGDIFQTQQSNVEHALEINFSSPHTNLSL